MELDTAFEHAVILSWADLMKVVSPAAVRVEYRRESKSLLDQVTVWVDRGKGYCDRVCDYWTSPSSTRPKGLRFRNGYDSDQLVQALGFIMHNPDRFTGPDTARSGLVLVYPPGEEQRAEAAIWREAALETPIVSAT